MNKLRPLAGFCFLALAFQLVASKSALAELTIPIAPDLTKIGWEVLEFDNIPVSDFIGTKDGVLEVRANKSSSVLYRKLADDPVQVSQLSWSWEVIDGLPATDLTKTDGDDRVLALHVVFADDSFTAKLAGMMSPFARGRVLTYVWGDDQMREFAHPHLPDKAWMMIKRTSDTQSGKWLDETVDLNADFKRAFGDDAPPVAYIGISGDADDLGATCFGRVRSIVFN